MLWSPLFYYLSQNRCIFHFYSSSFVFLSFVLSILSNVPFSSLRHSVSYFSLMNNMLYSRTPTVSYLRAVVLCSLFTTYGSVLQLISRSYFSCDVLFILLFFCALCKTFFAFIYLMLRCCYTYWTSVKFFFVLKLYYAFVIHYFFSYIFLNYLLF